jgi:hypothetical protein
MILPEHVHIHKNHCSIAVLHRAGKQMRRTKNPYQTEVEE